MTSWPPSAGCSRIPAGSGPIGVGCGTVAPSTTGEPRKTGDPRRPAALIAGLRPPWWSSVRLAVESLTGTVSDRYRELAGDSEAATLDELTGDDFSTVGEDRGNHPLLAPVVIVGGLLLLASLAAARSLFGLGHLDAPALLPSPDRLGELWASAASPIPGAPGVAPPPWLALMALGSTVLAGQPEWLVSTLLLGVVPLAYLAVYPLLRATVDDRRVRICAAVAYAMLPVLLGGTNQGRLTLSVVAILLPMLVLALRGLVLRRPRAPEAWRGGWGAGVVLVGLTAFEPSLILVAVVLGAVGRDLAAADPAEGRPDRSRRRAAAAGLGAVVAGPDRVPRSAVRRTRRRVDGRRRGARGLGAADRSRGRPGSAAALVGGHRPSASSGSPRSSGCPPSPPGRGRRRLGGRGDRVGGVRGAESPGRRPCRRPAARSAPGRGRTC